LKLKLQNKLAFYNAFSKIIIIVTIGIVLPKVVEKVVYNHIDSRLHAKKDKVFNLIKRGGLQQITFEEDCSFGNYNLLKQEFISILPLTEKSKQETIENTERMIEGEVIPHRVLSVPFFHDNQHYELEIGEGLGAIKELNKRIKTFIIYLLVIVIFLSILIDIGFIKLILVPLNKIIKTKLNVKHPSYFNLEPVKSSTFEFQHLDHSLNEMMNKIKDAFLVEKEFIANVSHELLTPISILKNRLENMLVDDQLSEESAIKIVESQKILSRLAKIIQALLLISKIENDQFLKTDQIKISELLKEVLDDIEERLTGKNIKLHIDLTEDFACNKCNRYLLYTLFFNVINNAIKYNKPNGEIRIFSEKTNKNFIVNIKDTGIGIEKENLNVIFDRFKKIEGHDAESHGLGLPIVKTIAAFHNIQIEVDSQKEIGSTFKIIF